jgi:hypothetical protein
MEEVFDVVQENEKKRFGLRYLPAATAIGNRDGATEADGAAAPTTEDAVESESAKSI